MPVGVVSWVCRAHLCSVRVVFMIIYRKAAALAAKQATSAMRIIKLSLFGGGVGSFLDPGAGSKEMVLSRCSNLVGP